MINVNQTVFLIPALEFLQNVGGEREEGDEDQNDTAVNSTNDSDDVGLAAAGTIDSQHKFASLHVQDDL
jgi:hypothetical protein